MLLKLHKLIKWVGLIVCVLVSLLAGGWVTGGPVWSVLSNAMGMDETVAVGSQAQADTPQAHSIQDMENLKRFMVRQLQKGEHNDDGIYLTDQYYWFITLDSGEVVALYYDPDMDTDFYDSTQDIWYSPVGTWRPWELTEQERAILAREAPELTTTAYYADMEGTGWTRMTRDSFVGQFWLLGSAVLLVCLAALWMLCLKLRAVLGESSQPKNDLELWLTGTYAIWGQYYTDFAMGRKYALTHPIHIGGCPRMLGAAKLMKMTLKGSWNITDYGGILETVEYMSKGPGLWNCSDQGGRAWELCRSMQLLGCAYLVGWCNRKELLRRSREVGLTMQRHFQSWEELCQGFLDGYSAWRLSDGSTAENLAEVQQRADIYWELRGRKNSPYRLPWNMDLAADRR